VYQAIRQRIVQGYYSGGQKLKEVELAAELQVSRTPVREALKRLAQGGLVVQRPHGGAHVTPLTARTVVEVYEVRMALESLAARLAAARATAEDVAGLRAVNAEYRRLAAGAGPPEGLQAVAGDFHARILAAARNEILTSTLANIHDHMARCRRLLVISPETNAFAVATHDLILEAIAEGAEDMAEQLMRAHIDYSRRRVLQSLGVTRASRQA
jgi:DNA-binding GntR family transcriptional regulator